MSVGATPSLNFIGDTVGDVAPHAMSEMRGIRFASGNSPTTGAISLSDFRNQVLTPRWPEQAKIQASDKQGGAFFGEPVSISSDGNTAIVGARLKDATGVAYIFTRSGTTWNEQQKIQASDKQGSDFFGTVAISGDGNTAIVGASGEDTGGSLAGAAYIFTRSGTTWNEQQKIQASDKQGGDNFGRSVSISSDGNTVIVGAEGEDTGGGDAGAAYIFTRSGTTWTQQKKIQASDKQGGDGFGYSVAISGNGNTAIVGASGEDTVVGTNTIYDTGAAYIFTRSGTTWNEQQKIRASDKEQNDRFGTSVAISDDGNTAIVGALYEGTGGGQAGAAYIFTRSGTNWNEQQKIQASDKQASDNFGESVSISSDGNTVIVGAWREDTGGRDAGAAYIFTRSGTNWNEQQKIQASDKQFGDNFGESVAISGDGNTTIVGAWREGTGGTDAGAAYTFETSYYI
jgi:hypothetical protein